MAPRGKEPMYTSSLSMLGHSLATWEAGEFRQALALGSQVAIGTGSRLRLVPGVDTNFTLELPARRGPTARRFAVCAPGRQNLPAGLFGTAFRDCLGFRIKIAALPAAEIQGWVMLITRIRLRVRIALDPISADVRQPPPVVITLCAV